MFSYIKGIVTEVSDGFVTIETGGIGYGARVSSAVLARVKNGEEFTLFTHIDANESGVTLLGFTGKEERDMYFKITSVAGVGAKAALGLLSVMSPSQLAVAIISEDITSLTRAAGVGKKVAARIVMELKEKLAESSDFAAETVVKPQGTISGGILSESAEAKRDAADALAALGYSRSEAVKATLEVSSDGMTSEQIIKAALKKLNR